MAVPRIRMFNKKQVCFKCNTEISYSKKFDCYYCDKCHIWLEPKCDDLFCMFCRKRPTRPQIVVKKKKTKKKKKIEWD